MQAMNEQDGYIYDSYTYLLVVGQASNPSKQYLDTQSDATVSLLLMAVSNQDPTSIITQFVPTSQRSSTKVDAFLRTTS